jgi:putative phosphoesterase
MRIGLISDTHMPEVAQVLPPQIAEAFRGVDLILHAGDIYASSVLDELEHIAPVLAAKGDDDSGDMLIDRRVKWKHVLKLEGQTLWLIHYMPYPYSVASWRARISLGQGEHDAPDIVVFGHDHCTILHHHSGVLFVNPGSPTFLNYRHGLGTVGILDIDSGKAQAHIIQL